MPRLSAKELLEELLISPNFQIVRYQSVFSQRNNLKHYSEARFKYLKQAFIDLGFQSGKAQQLYDVFWHLITGYGYGIVRVKYYNTHISKEAYCWASKDLLTFLNESRYTLTAIYNSQELHDLLKFMQFWEVLYCRSSKLVNEQTEMRFNAILRANSPNIGFKIPEKLKALMGVESANDLVTVMNSEIYISRTPFVSWISKRVSKYFMKNPMSTAYRILTTPKTLSDFKSAMGAEYHEAIEMLSDLLEHRVNNLHYLFDEPSESAYCY